jgi:hypothetical protein
MEVEQVAADMEALTAEVAAADTLDYWMQRCPAHVSITERDVLARAALATFRLMVRVGVT